MTRVGAQPQIEQRAFWSEDEQGAFAMALCRDARGDVWAGAEDKGVWRLRAGRWQNLSAGLDDDTVYALAAEASGRVWAGTSRGGVAVWNGETWKRFGPLECAIGERVFDIAVAPDGAVWIAHSNGLSRWHLKKWTLWTRAPNRPADAISALAFDAEGNLVAGTQCEGVALAARADDYANWKLVPGPQTPTVTPVGEGLPSNQINDVLPARDGRIYAATSEGLSWSDDSGSNWHYLRGSNWRNKHRLRPGAPALELGDEAAARTLLPEDYVASLAQSDDGKLWLGFRRNGYLVMDIEAGRAVYNSEVDGTRNADFVTAILPRPDGATLVALHGGGVVQSLRPEAEKTRAASIRPSSRPEGTRHPEFDRTHPEAPPSPTEAELEARREEIAALSAPGEAHVLPDDWATQGNWPGRYGANYFQLCGTSTRTNDWSSHPSYRASVAVGPHVGGAIYSYTMWLQTDLRRALFFPRTGGRRQSEWNDGSWDADKYPLDGPSPDLWVRFDVPAGSHRASFYFFNKDGHASPKHWRDYDLQLGRETPQETGAAPVLARARVQNFWGGVYKNFAVTGPGSYVLKISRNHSHLVILQGVFLDRIGGPIPTNENKTQPAFVGIEPETPLAPALENPNDTLQAALALWQACETSPNRSSLVRAAQLEALRAAAANGAPETLLAAWRHALRVWLPADEATFARYQKRAQSARNFKP